MHWLATTCAIFLSFYLASCSYPQNVVVENPPEPHVDPIPDLIIEIFDAPTTQKPQVLETTGAPIASLDSQDPYSRRKKSYAPVELPAQDLPIPTTQTPIEFTEAPIFEATQKADYPTGARQYGQPPVVLDPPRVVPTLAPETPDQYDKLPVAENPPMPTFAPVPETPAPEESEPYDQPRLPVAENPPMVEPTFAPLPETPVPVEFTEAPRVEAIPEAGYSSGGRARRSYPAQPVQIPVDPAALDSIVSQPETAESVTSIPLQGTTFAPESVTGFNLLVDKDGNVIDSAGQLVDPEASDLGAGARHSRHTKHSKPYYNDKLSYGHDGSEEGGYRHRPHHSHHNKYDSDYDHHDEHHDYHEYETEKKPKTGKKVVDGKKKQEDHESKKDGYGKKKYAAKKYDEYEKKPYGKKSYGHKAEYGAHHDEYDRPRHGYHAYRPKYNHDEYEHPHFHHHQYEDSHGHHGGPKRGPKFQVVSHEEEEEDMNGGASDVQIDVPQQDEPMQELEGTTLQVVEGTTVAPVPQPPPMPPMQVVSIDDLKNIMQPSGDRPNHPVVPQFIIVAPHAPQPHHHHHGSPPGFLQPQPIQPIHHPDPVEQVEQPKFIEEEIATTPEPVPELKPEKPKVEPKPETGNAPSQPLFDVPVHEEHHGINWTAVALGEQGSSGSNAPKNTLNSLGGTKTAEQEMKPAENSNTQQVQPSGQTQELHPDIHQVLIGGGQQTEQKPVPPQAEAPKPPVAVPLAPNVILVNPQVQQPHPQTPSEQLTWQPLVNPAPLPAQPEKPKPAVPSVPQPQVAPLPVPAPQTQPQLQQDQPKIETPTVPETPKMEPSSVPETQPAQPNNGWSAPQQLHIVQTENGGWSVVQQPNGGK